MSNLDILEGSALGGSFDVFGLSKFLAFQCPNYLEVSALVAGFLSLSNRLEVLLGS